MNWELFFATIVWVMAVIMLFVVVWTWTEAGYSTDIRRKRFVCSAVASTTVLVLCIATIAGMGWF